MKPWDNDGAADWFASFMEKTRLAKYVEETLNMEIEDGFYVDAHVVRAAASVLVLFGHTFVWPIEDLDGHLELAISRLEEILHRGYSPAEEQIKAEIELLRSRLNHQAQGRELEKAKWWQY